MHSPHTETALHQMRSTEFICLMAGIQALQALAIDVMLPALGVISGDLGQSDPNQRQLIVGIFLIGSGVGSLFPGAIADRFGRKPVIMTCLAVYFCISLACAMVTDFTALLILRGLLGVFTSGLLVMPMSIIRDRFSGDQMARMQSLVAMVFMVIPMIAPMMGQGVLLIADWRWIFGIKAGLALLVGLWAWQRLPETLHPEYRQAIALGTIARNMGEAMSNRSAIGYILGGACTYAALFGYINQAQQLVAEHFGAGKYFPFVFGGMALSLAACNFVNSTIVERFGARRVSHAALIAFITVNAIHFCVAWNGETLWAFVPLMGISFCLMAFVGSNFQSISLQPFARTAGVAASVMSFVRMVLGAVVGSMIGQAYDGSPRPMLASMFTAGVLALLLVLYSENGRLFRRLNYPPGFQHTK